MEIKQLRYFLALAKTGSMTSAAHSLYITQQALSKSISKMEETLGVILFERTQHGVRLTEYGKCLLPYARKIVQSAEAAYQAINEMKKAGQYTIHMGYVDGSFHSQSAVPPALIEEWEATQHEATVFQHEYPPDILNRLLLEEELDFAYTISPQGQEINGLTSITLAQEPLCLLFSQKELLGRKALSLQELEEIPILNWRIGVNPSEHFEQLCAMARFHPKMLYINTSFRQCIEHVRMGKGMMIAGISYYRSISSDGLEMIPFPSDQAVLLHVLMWKSEKNQPECIRQLISYIRKNHPVMTNY